MTKSLKKNDEAVFLETLIQLMKAENLDELEVSEGQSHIKLVRHHKVPMTMRSVPMTSSGFDAPAAAAKAPVEDGIPVKAPIPGIFYRSPSPSSPSFVKEGDTIAAGKPLCIIEAMKVMNEVTSPTSGVIKKILVENGKSIEANQVLFLLSA